jgi:hypothetical protein
MPASARNHVKAIQAPGRRTAATGRAIEEMPVVTARTDGPTAPILVRGNEPTAAIIVRGNEPIA